MPWEVGVDVIWRREGVGQGLTVTHSGIHSLPLTPTSFIKFWSVFLFF